MANLTKKISTFEYPDTLDTAAVFPIVQNSKNYKTSIQNVADYIASEVPNIEIVDNLASTDATKALSANQGKVLNDRIEDFDTTIEPLSLQVAGVTKATFDGSLPTTFNVTLTDLNTLDMNSIFQMVDNKTDLTVNTSPFIENNKIIIRIKNAGDQNTVYKLNPGDSIDGFTRASGMGGGSHYMFIINNDTIDRTLNWPSNNTWYAATADVTIPAGKAAWFTFRQGYEGDQVYVTYTIGH